MLAMPPNFRILRGCQKRRTPTKEEDGKVKDFEWGGNPPRSSIGIRAISALECSKCAEFFLYGLDQALARANMTDC